MYAKDWNPNYDPNAYKETEIPPYVGQGEIITDLTPGFMATHPSIVIDLMTAIKTKPYRGPGTFSLDDLIKELPPATVIGLGPKEHPSMNRIII